MLTKIYPKAILIDVIDPETSFLEAEKRLNEIESLVKTFGGIVVIKTIQKRAIPDYETYIGKGKVEEIIELARQNEAKILIINNLLKSRQIFNLEKALREALTKKEKAERGKINVWDRVDLILKIFDQHAKSKQAKLQIELASIRHMGPRIFKMGIELSRQAGVMGLRAGSGESNIEMMKRHLRTQELSIQKKLKHYEVINEGHRNRRRRQNFKTVAVVGYTNAGKTSLLNALTKKGAYVADQLFATLDTRIGKLYLPPKVNKKNEYTPGKEILISDTIGFIQDLPPDLIQAFKSTLAETIESDLILHVIDIVDDQIEKKIEVVEEILSQLGLNNKPKIYVFNKIDLIKNFDMKKKAVPFNPNSRKKYPGVLKAGKKTAKILGWHTETDKIKLLKYPAYFKRKYKTFNPVFISANEKKGFEELIEAIEKKYNFPPGWK